NVAYIYGVPNTPEILASSNFNFPANMWHHLTLNVVGQTVRAWIDGTNVLNSNLVTGNPNDPIGPSYGKIGLKAIDGGTAQFDNVTVTTVPEPSTLLLIWIAGSSLLGAKHKRD